MSKHTPGPWRARRTAGCIKVTVGNPANGCVDEVCVIDTDENDTADADATLIAAAPDMLEALRIVDELLPLLARAANREDARAVIRAAIAKAEGRS